MTNIKYLLGLLIPFLLSSCSGDNQLKDVTRGFDFDLLPCFIKNTRGEYVYTYTNFEGEDLIEVYTGPYPMTCSMFCEGLAFVERDDFKGFINTEGDEVVNLDGFRARDRYFSEGLYLTDDERKNISAFNTKGEVVWEATGAVGSQLRGGFALWKPSSYHSYFGLIDSKGNIIFEPVTTGDKDDYEYIPKDYLDIMDNPACCAHPSYFPIFGHDGFKYFLNAATGEHLLEGVLSDVDYTYLAIDMNDRIVMRQYGKYGLMDLNGDWIVEPQYKELENDGKWYVCNEDGLYGWIDKDGNEVIPAQFESGLTPVFGVSDWCLIDENTFIDRKGEIVLEVPYEAVSNFIGDRCLVSLRKTRYYDVYSWMNREGELVGAEIKGGSFKFSISALSKGWNIRCNWDL